MESRGVLRSPSAFLVRVLLGTAIVAAASAVANAGDCFIYRLTINRETTRDEVYWSVAGEGVPARDAVQSAAERSYGYGAFDMVVIATLGAGEQGCPANNGGYPISRDLGVIR